MNAAHQHLLINHFPIVGSIMALIVLGYGIKVKSEKTITAAFFLLIISGVTAGIAYYTGESAEDVLESLNIGVENLIEEHEEASMPALIASLVAGVFSVIGLILINRKSPAVRSFSIIVFLIVLINAGMMARSGYLGGKIRHTEINGGTGSNVTEGHDD